MPTDAKALAHAEGEPADPLAGDADQPDEVDDLIDPGPADAVAPGERDEVVASGPFGMNGFGLQQDSQLDHRRLRGPVVAAVDPDGSRCGFVQARDHPHRGGLAGPVRTEEPGHDPGLYGEGQRIDGEFVTVLLRHVLYFDH